MQLVNFVETKVPNIPEYLITKNAIQTDKIKAGEKIDLSECKIAFDQRTEVITDGKIQE